MQLAGAFVEQGRCPADDFSDRVGQARDRRGGHRTGARGVVTSRETLARDLTTARDRTLRLVDFDDAEAAAPVRPADEPAGLGPRAHRPAGRAVAAARRRPARPGLLPPDVERALRRVPQPRASPRRLPLLPPAEARAYCATCAAGRWTAWSAARPTTDRTTFAFGHGRQPREPARRNDAAGAEPARRPAAAGTGRAAAARPARRRRNVGARARRRVRARRRRGRRTVQPGQRAARRTSSTCPPFRIGRVPVTNGEWRQFIADGGYATTAWWSAAAGRTASEAGLTRAACSGTPDGTRTRFGVVEELPPDEPVQHVTFFEAEAYAAWAGARLPTEVEWEKAVRVGPAARRAPPLPVGGIGADRRTGQPRRRRAAPRPGRRLPGRRVGLRRRADAGRRLGVDDLAADGLAGLHADALRAILRSRSSAATTRCCAAVRGRSRRASCGPASATGTTRSAGRSSRGCAGLAVGRRLMCRHLAGSVNRARVASLVLEPPSALLVQSYAPRRQSTA